MYRKNHHEVSRCGVFVPNENGGHFCEERSFSYRRCSAHYRALAYAEENGHSLLESLRRMGHEQRELALDMLDNNEKRRPSWCYENPEGEEELMRQNNE